MRVNNFECSRCHFSLTDPITWLRATFEAADKSGDGLLSIDEILKLLHKLNVSLSKRKVKQLFKVRIEISTSIWEGLQGDFLDFYTFINDFLRRPDQNVTRIDYIYLKEYYEIFSSSHLNRLLS